MTAASGGGAVTGVVADVYDGNGNLVAQASTDGSGNYSVTGLTPSATGYTVCFDASNATGGSSTTGYQSQCYSDVAWSPGSNPPSGTTAVPVPDGQVATGINAALAADGGISGTVTAASGGGAVTGVVADVYDSNGSFVAQAQTDGSGNYSVTGLVPSATGYTVCFDASNATGGSSTTGYQSQCYSDVAWSPGSNPPSGTTAVPVTSGSIAAGIDAALAAEGGISGTVTAASGGGGVTGVRVDVYDSNANFVAQGATDGSGNYSVTGLTPSATGYTVCFDASSATGGSSTTGYESQCYKNVPWLPGNNPPSGTTAVPVSAGSIATGIDAALAAEGGISGTVTAASGGGAVTGVVADVYDSNGSFVAQGSTDGSGNYSVTGLVPSATGYTVCFDASSATGGSSTTGYESQCYKNVPWLPGNNPPSGTTAVPVSAGQVATGIGAALVAEGGISGAVTAASGGGALTGVAVYLYDSTGNFLAQTATDSAGSYSFSGLLPSATGYTVCFSAAGATGGSSTTGYESQCYKNVAWTTVSIPPGTTPVPVQSGKTTTGIDAALVSEGGISGTATAAVGGGGVSAVTVDVYDSGGNFVTQVSTDSSGAYLVAGLLPSPSGYTVCFDASGASGGGSTTGYESQCYKDVAWTPGNNPPSGTTAVPVSSGSIATGIDAALAAAGGISGTVTAAVGGGAVSGVTVGVYDSGGNFVTQVSTDASGAYSVTGLVPSTAGYTVCFDASGATGGSSTTGYESQCYKNVPWSPGSNPPSGTTAVPVPSGPAVTGIDAALAAAGGISGTVTAAVGGGPVTGVVADVYDSNGNFVTQAVTDGSGAYSVTGLVPSTAGYTVCFDASGASGGGSTTGYESQCYKDVAWTPGNNPPSGTTAVPVSSGSIATGIDAALAAAGGISGTVTAAAGGGAVSGVSVDVYDSGGNFLTQVSTDSSGAYAVIQLAPSATGYLLCFDASSASGGGSTTGYQSQCYKNVAWVPGNTLPSGITPVPVGASQAVTGIDAALAAAGGISGTVTAASSGQPVANVAVRVFNSLGEDLADVSTSTTGTYSITGLVPSATEYVVCFDASAATGGGSATGYESQCYNKVAWTGGFVPAPGASPVPVSSGQTTSGIDAPLAAAGAISGTVTAASGGGLSGVLVDVTDNSGTFVTQATTDATGKYSANGLAPSASGYTVCFDATSASGGASATGYASQCYRNLPWTPGTNPPAGTTSVPVALGKATSGVNGKLLAQQGISGTVTDARTGTGLAGVAVRVFDANGLYLVSTTTTTGGKYAVAGLAGSGGGYLVCFDATGLTSYASQCYRNVSWPGGFIAPLGATPVQLLANSPLTINVGLKGDGSIAGMVTASDTGTGVANISVDVYDSAGAYITSAASGPDGSYAVGGLTPSKTGYVVCFDASQAGTATQYAGQCYKNVPWSRTSDLPAGLTAVPVTAGQTAAGINALLVPAGSIAGTVTAAAGGAGLAGVAVDVLDSAGNPVTTATTDSSGGYSVTGLAPSATGYTVCFDATNATGGRSATGYGSQCYQNVAWMAGASPPSGTKPVPVSSGKTTSRIGAALAAAGAISGTVTAEPGGAGLGGVVVDLYDSNGNLVGTASSDSSGLYGIIGLAPSPAGYTVCFDATAATGGASSVGYQSQCYQKKAWTPGSNPPSGTKPVPVSSGKTATGIGAALASAGAISGTVTAASGGGGVSGVVADIYNGAGNFVTQAVTDGSGDYSVTGLVPSTGGYTVCFDASGIASAGFADQCYKKVPWAGGEALPSGTTPVPVAAGQNAAGIGAALVTGASISGTVTAATGGAPLAGVQVDVFGSNGTAITTVESAADGTYTATGLLASATGYTVCFDASTATGGGSASGYASQCYRNVAWSGNSLPPSRTTLVPVTSGSAVTGVNARLSAAGAISGTVTAKTGGAGLAGVAVRVYDSGGHFVAQQETGVKGTYTLGGLAPARGYEVCFDATQARGGTSKTGYADQCYKGVAWSGGLVLPSGMTSVPVTAGVTATGISAALGTGASISGTVTAATGGGALTGVQIAVFDPAGNLLANALSGANGSYRLAGLQPSRAGYLVCFEATSATGGSSRTGYADQCYSNVAWTGAAGPPAGAKRVPVTAGSVKSGISARLRNK